MNWSLAIILLLVISCRKDECKTCSAVSYSDEYRKCGQANNGLDIINTQPLGEFCDESDIKNLRAQGESIVQVPARVCSLIYTVTTKIECK